METSRKVSTKIDRQTKQQTKDINKQRKHAFKQTWTDTASKGDEEVGQDIPNNFKNSWFRIGKLSWRSQNANQPGKKESCTMA